MFTKGHSIIEFIGIFEKMATLIFTRRAGLPIPLLSRAYEVLASYFTNGLYPVANIENAMKETSGSEKSILDYSYVTSIGTRVGLPVATFRFKISLKQSPHQPYNVSKSPFSVKNLIYAQGIDCRFNAADHGKRKRTSDVQSPVRKRRQL